MQLKRYSRNEPLIFILFLVPYTFFINLLMLGLCIFSSLKVFFRGFVISFVYFALIYLVFGSVAMLIRKRFPADHELFRRIAVMLPVFYFMNLLSVLGVYFYYDQNAWLECLPLKHMFWWVICFGCLASTLLTFLNEAVVGWEKWKTSVTETSRLHNAYQKSRLLMLKRQINPHFLFNCFNTLSSLIQENGEEAELFLDELTKVYRYLLQGDEKKLVSLDEELKFTGSYIYLGKTRFGSALRVDIAVDENCRLLKMAPLSLQVVLENIIYSNAFSKTSPLVIHIRCTGGRELNISNTVQLKNRSEISDHEEALDDLVRKYKLLCKPEIKIHENVFRREIIIPLIENEEITL